MITIENRPALFLDRDGVVIKHVPYISDPEQVELMPGIVDLLRAAKQKGWFSVVVTNQSGIGRGYFGWDEYHQVQDRMHELLRQEGVKVDDVFVSPYYQDSEFDTPEYFRLRKPEPGMILDASEKHGIDLARSVMIGDRISDVQAGYRAGVNQLYLIRNGYFAGESEAVQEWSAEESVSVSIIEALNRATLD